MLKSLWYHRKIKLQISDYNIGYFLLELYPAGIDLLKVKIRKVEKGVKYVQT